MDHEILLRSLLIDFPSFRSLCVSVTCLSYKVKIETYIFFNGPDVAPFSVSMIGGFYFFFCRPEPTDTRQQPMGNDWLPCMMVLYAVAVVAPALYMSSRVFHQDSGSCGSRHWSPSIGFKQDL